MNDLEKILLELKPISSSIGKVLKSSSYEEYDDLSGLNINYEDAEQLLLLDELRRIIQKLDDVKARVDYLNKPVIWTKRLSKNESGKYETSKKEYSCGARIEALVSNDYHDVPYWAITRVEHDGDDYYLVGYKDVPLEHLTVRARG